jgi:hypothetical protein
VMGAADGLLGALSAAWLLVHLNRHGSASWHGALGSHSPRTGVTPHIGRSDIGNGRVGRGQTSTLATVLSMSVGKTAEIFGFGEHLYSRHR